MPSRIRSARAVDRPARRVAITTSVHAISLETISGSSFKAWTNSAISGSRATSFTIAEESRYSTS